MVDNVAELGLKVSNQGFEEATAKAKTLQDQLDKTAKSADTQSAAFDKTAKSVDGLNKSLSGGGSSGGGGGGGITSGDGPLSARAIGALTLFGVAATAAAVAAGYIAYQWADAQEKVSQSLLGIGARAGETVQSINNFSVANASATGLSISQARDVAVEFNKTGAVAVSGLKGLGDAVEGYSILTGETATKATQKLAKAFTGDLKGALDIASNTYGAMNGAIRDQVDALLLVGDRTAAAQVIIRAMEATNTKASDSVGILTKAWNLLGNTVSAVVNLPAFGRKSLDPNQQLAAARQGQEQDNTQIIGGEISITPSIKELQKAADAFNADKINTQLNSMAEAGNNVVKSVIPEIDQIERLKVALATLQEAQNTPGVQQGSVGTQDQAAVERIKFEIAALQDAQSQATNYKQRVNEISASWGDVGQSTALALQAAQNHLPVVQAVGGAERMSAQYAADFADAVDKGKTAIESEALAASNLSAHMAQVKAAAEETLFSLQNALPVAQAWTTATQMKAQQEATYNKLLHDGVDAETAAAVAAAQFADAQAKAQASAQKMVQSSQDNLDKINAQGTGMEGVVTASIAYRDAIQAGASATQAAAIYSNTLAANMAQAAQAAAQMENSQIAAANAQYTAAGGNFGQAGGYASGGEGTPTSVSGGVSTNSEAYIQYVRLTSMGYSDKDATGIINAAYAKSNYTATTGPAASAAANSQKALVNSLDNLTTSTKSLNATNQDLLSPFYTQDPRTSHIGFRSQGMATGGEITIPGGYSANDNMFVNVPVASGEILSVRRPGQSASGGGGTTISMPVTIQGIANRDDVGRTMYQAAQTTSRQLAAAGR